MTLVIQNDSSLTVRTVATREELQAIIEQLEWCNYQCEAGSLHNNASFVRLRELAGLPAVAHPKVHEKEFEGVHCYDTQKECSGACACHG